MFPLMYASYAATTGRRWTWKNRITRAYVEANSDTQSLGEASRITLLDVTHTKEHKIKRCAMSTFAMLYNKDL